MEEILFDIVYKIVTCLPVPIGLTNSLPYPLKRRVKYIICILFLLSYIVLYPIVNSFIVLINAIITVIIIFFFSEKDKRFRNIFSSIIGYLSFISIDYLILLLLFIFFGISMEAILISKINYTIFCTFMTIIISLISPHIGVLMKKGFEKKIQYNHRDIFSKKVKILLFIDIVLRICIFLFVIIFIGSLPPKRSSNLLLIATILFISLFIFNVYTTLKTIYITRTNLIQADKVERQRTQILFNDHLNSANTNFRTFKHDYDNIKSYLGQFIMQDRFDEANYFLNKKILPFVHQMENEKCLLSKLSSVEVNHRIKELLLNKLLSAVQAEINIDLDIPFDVTNINMNIDDCAALINLFLNQAYTTAHKSKERNIFIRFYQQQLYLIVEMKYSFHPQNNDVLDDKSIYSKPISRIISKYPNIEWVTPLVEEKYVTQKIIIFEESDKV